MCMHGGLVLVLRDVFYVTQICWNIILILDLMKLGFTLSFHKLSVHLRLRST